MKYLCVSLFQLTTHQELWAFIVTNLASVYIREGNRDQEVRGHLGCIQDSRVVVCDEWEFFT